MKKITQAIIGATLILDIAVVFTFGLAVISSFEDGSRLPEATFVRRSIEKRVAGTTACPATANMYIKSPTSGPITSQIFKMSTGVNGGAGFTTSTQVFFIYTINVSPFRKEIPAVHQLVNNGTSLPFPYNSEWVADIDILRENIPNGSFTFHAEGRDSAGNCIVKSVDSSIDINFIPPAVPAVSITLPATGEILSGHQATITGEITNLPSGTQIQEALIKIFTNAIQVAGPFPAPALNAANPLTRQSIFDSTTIANGAYNVKMFVHYAGADGLLKFIESSPVAVNINNTSTTSTNSSNDQNVNSNSNTSSGTNYNSNTSTANINASTSTSGTNMNNTTSINASTDTTTPPPDSSTTTTSVSIISPASLITLRFRDNPLVAKTSAAVSGLKFIIHKSGEPVTQFIAIDTASSDKINWKANMSLMTFNDGEYDITAVVGDIKSAPLSVIAQKFAFNWINPIPTQTVSLSGNVPIKVKIGGIYERDGITPVKGVKAYFYQTNTQAPYTEIYNEQLYQNPNTPEWRLYDWTLKREKLWKTDNSSNGKYRLIIKVINESISVSNIWFPTEPIFIEINNQQAVLPSNNANISVSGVNNNQNINAAALNTAATNTAAANSSNTTVSQNANAANNSPAVAAPSDSDQDGLSDEDERTRGTDPNSVDTDKDGLIDFEEIDKYATDPLKNDTDGDSYLDGEEVQSLHDPLKPPTDPSAAVLVKSKPVEEPKASVKPILESLVVEKIENKEIKTTPPPSTNETNSQPLTQETTENTIVLQGKGPANTILTLFIYSVDPLVITVKTDDDGNWEYELDKKLEDGEHELYVTVTDDTGKIQSQSNPIAFFVKEAKAVSPENYRADLAAREPVKTSSTDIYLIASGVLVLIAVIAGLAVALRRKSGI